MKLYGFVCFYDPHGFDSRGDDGGPARIVLKNAGARDEVIQIDRADRPLIALSRERSARLAGQESFGVVRRADGGEAVYLLSARTGWNQTRGFLEKLIASPDNALFMARFMVGECEVYLGSGDVFRVDDTLFWIGMVLVHPEVQRQGIARRLMEKCLAFSYERNRNAIVGLDATPLGKPLYERLGFRESFNIWLCTLPAEKQPADFRDGPEVKKISRGGDPQAYLDKRLVSGKGARTQLLRALGDEGCFMALERGRIVGVVFSRPGRIRPHVGPLIADSDLIATALLRKVSDYWKKKDETRLFLMIPEHHFGEREKDGCREWAFRLPFRVTCERVLSRMYHLPAAGEGGSPGREDHIRAIGNYMARERREVLPRLFAIGGAEIS